VDEQGRDILVYHGRDYDKIEGDPLFNPDRHTRIQRLYTDASGNPDFGVPVGNGPLPERFTPAVRRNLKLAHEGDRLMVGTAPLAQTQFRSQPAGDGAVTLSPILKPDYRLVASADGAVALLPSGEGGPNGADRFRRETAPGGAVRFISQAFTGMALAHFSDKVVLARTTDSSSAWLVD
jgi:hypothetical protein